MSGSYKEGQIVSCSSESPVYEVVQAYSPGYPFDASIPCDFLLNVEEGKNVELEVCCENCIIIGI